MHDLRRHGVEHLVQHLGEVRDQRVADVVPRLRLQPVGGDGPLEERVEERPEPLRVLERSDLSQPGLHERGVVLLSLGHPRLLLTGSAIRGVLEVVASPGGGAPFPVRQRRQEPRNGLGLFVHDCQSREVHPVPTRASGECVSAGREAEIQNLSHPPATLPSMGTVISIEDWRNERLREEPAERLEIAVESLDAVMQGSPQGRLADPDVERELLAITGAVSLGMLEEAADRAERLRERLLRHARSGG